MPDTTLAATTITASLEMYTTRDHRVGMRSALMDAAHLCDAIAADISKTGRKSMRRDQLVAVAKRCGDAIEAMRELVEVPHPGNGRQPPTEPAAAPQPRGPVLSEGVEACSDA